MRIIKDLYKEIEDEKEIIPFVKLTGKEDLLRQCRMIYPLQIVVNQSIQTGNYRRAVRYTAALKTILRNLEDNERDIQSILTSKVLEQNSMNMSVAELIHKMKKFIMNLKN